MHELSLMSEVVAAVVEVVGDAKVTRVRLEVGRLAAVVPDALRFCFDVCTEGTPLEGATLVVDEVPGRGRCHDCGATCVMNDPLAACACGCPVLEVVDGRELRVKDVEVWTCARPVAAER